jgi:hypothetical protein
METFQQEVERLRATATEVRVITQLIEELAQLAPDARRRVLHHVLAWAEEHS